MSHSGKYENKRRNVRTKYGIAILLLAIVCLSALSAPSTDLSQAGSSAYLGPGWCLAGPLDWMLLADDATKNKLQNMTSPEINELKQMKMDELDNVTPFQIEALRLKKERQG
jgi:hypothetical protein